MTAVLERVVSTNSRSVPEQRSGDRSFVPKPMPPKARLSVRTKCLKKAHRAWDAYEADQTIAARLNRVCDGVDHVVKPSKRRDNHKTSEQPEKSIELGLRHLRQLRHGIVPKDITDWRLVKFRPGEKRLYRMARAKQSSGATFITRELADLVATTSVIAKPAKGHKPKKAKRYELDMFRSFGGPIVLVG